MPWILPPFLTSVCSPPRPGLPPFLLPHSSNPRLLQAPALTYWRPMGVIGGLLVHRFGRLSGTAIKDLVAAGLLVPAVQSPRQIGLQKSFHHFLCEWGTQEDKEKRVCPSPDPVSSQTSDCMRDEEAFSLLLPSRHIKLYCVH